MIWEKSVAETSMSCCPPESLGQLGQDGYKTRGTIVTRHLHNHRHDHHHFHHDNDHKTHQQPPPPLSHRLKNPLLKLMPKIVFTISTSTWAQPSWSLITTRGDLPIYVVGSGSKGIIWNYDIFGFDSGRTKQLCDIVADAGVSTLCHMLTVQWSGDILNVALCWKKCKSYK